ncbi:hypothetical protein MTO96_001429 [Rhipicephalus appendiculatus]
MIHDRTQASSGDPVLGKLLFFVARLSSAESCGPHAFRSKGPTEGSQAPMQAHRVTRPRTGTKSLKQWRRRSEPGRKLRVDIKADNKRRARSRSRPYQVGGEPRASARRGIERSSRGRNANLNIAARESPRGTRALARSSGVEDEVPEEERGVAQPGEDNF